MQSKVMESNLEVARKYSQKIYSTTGNGGTWVSSLHSFSKEDREAILKVYRSVFQVVEINHKNGICTCKKME